MIKEIKCKNFKSFKKEQILSLEPINRLESDLDFFNITEIGGEQLFKTAVIYGHNAYGKSNLFKALKTMIQIIKFSGNNDYEINVDNFKLDEESSSLPSMFEITFVLNKITYRYGFEIFKDTVIKEWLYKKNKREVNVYNRENEININTSYRDKLKKYVEFTRKDELFLSSMIRNNIQDEIKAVYEKLTKSIVIISGEQINTQITSTLILENDEHLIKELVLNCLKFADLGISDINVTEDEKSASEIQEQIVHKKYNSEDIEIGTTDFDLLANESEGTIKFYSLLGPILDSLLNGKSIFIDELDSKLHNTLTTKIINLFNNLGINKKNSQLIFNTHDLQILSDKFFRRDQIYIVDKNEYGESELASIGDYKGIDKKTNILKHYLAGNFGGIGRVKDINNLSFNNISNNNLMGD
ncbi:MAG: AAA family ATPase [Cetobacterium sp.]